MTYFDSTLIALAFFILVCLMHYMWCCAVLNNPDIYWIKKIWRRQICVVDGRVVSIGLHLSLWQRVEATLAIVLRLSNPSVFRNNPSNYEAAFNFISYFSTDLARGYSCDVLIVTEILAGLKYTVVEGTQLS